MSLGAIFLGSVTTHMAIFVRTEEGQEAAYSPQSALPRKLKSILKVIDGRTTLNAFEKNLSSFGDVRAILQSLDMAGLNKQVEGGGASPSLNAEPTLMAVVAPNTAALAPRHVPPARSNDAGLGAWTQPRAPAMEASNSISMESWQASELAIRGLASVECSSLRAFLSFLTSSSYAAFSLPFCARIVTEPPATTSPAGHASIYAASIAGNCTSV